MGTRSVDGDGDIELSGDSVSAGMHLREFFKGLVLTTISGLAVGLADP